MRRKSFRAGIFAALLAALALCAVPTFASAASQTDQSQNTRITRHAKSIKKIVGAVTALSGRIKTIEDAAPQIISGLGQLKDAATQLKDGLTQLKDATTAGFDKVTTSFKSTEYGFGQVIVLVGGTTPTPEGGSFIETPDIPDAVQQAQVSQEFIAQHTGTLIVSYGVRSGESDGTGASNPAALCRVFAQKGTAIEQTAANGALGGLPFQPVNTKSPLTSTDVANSSFPFGLKTSGADADVTQNLSTAIAVAPGDAYTVGMSCVDTTPDPNDPSA